MKPSAILPIALLAVCVACGGGGGSNPPAGPLRPTITGTATTPPMSSYQYGQPITLQWSLAGGAPTSTLFGEFNQGRTSLDPLATSVVVTPTHPTSYTVIVENNVGVDSATWTFVQLPSTTTVTSNTNPCAVGQTVTFTAAVTLGATGVVGFSDAAGSTVVRLGTGTLSSGSAIFSTSDLAAGTHLITATYSGDQSFAASQSTVLAQTVTP